MGKRISKKNLTTPPDKVERLSAVDGLFSRVAAILERTPEIRHMAGDKLASGGDIDPKHHKAGDVLHDLSLAIEKADEEKH